MAHIDPMQCRKCGGRGKVIDTRKCVGYRRRRHACERCGLRWNSFVSLLNPKKAIRRWLKDQAEA